MHTVTDNSIDSRLLRRLQDDWPMGANWLAYESPGERKQTLRDDIPAAHLEAIHWLNELCPLGLVPDKTLHGAGLHMLMPGGFLDPHLDCDVHPVTGYRRAQNAILFLDDFSTDWGGDLYLYDPDLSGWAKRITPKAGRMVVFDCDDKSYHGVPGPVCGPIPRRSIAVYWWEPGQWTAKRPRAQFVALANETPNPEKDKWRLARSAATR